MFLSGPVLSGPTTKKILFAASYKQMQYRCAVNFGTLSLQVHGRCTVRDEVRIPVSLIQIYRYKDLFYLDFLDSSKIFFLLYKI